MELEVVPLPGRHAVARQDSESVGFDSKRRRLRRSVQIAHIRTNDHNRPLALSV
jgi:hypothetical protein